MADKIEVDFRRLTLRDISDIERTLGIGFDKAFNGAMKGQAIAAAAWVTKRRVEPSFTFEDALDLEFGEIEFTGEVEDAGNSPRPEGPS